MFGLKTIAWSIAAALAAAIIPVTAFADSNSTGEITAQWSSINTLSMPKAVRINSRWYAAGEIYIRVDGQADVPVYSLGFNDAADRTSQFQAIDPETSAVSHLDQISFLVLRSNGDASRGTLTSVLSAAYQIAIWHLADNITINRSQVPDPVVRSDVRKLIRVSRANCNESKCADDISTAATSATLSLAVGKTVDSAVLRVAIMTPIVKFFNKRQYVDVRINGLGVTLCPGETDKIRIDKPVTHSILKSSCEYRSLDPSQRGLLNADLPRLSVDRISTDPANSVVNNVITALVPRQSSSQLVQVLWSFSSGPGMIFMPDDFSSPIITASAFADTRTASTTIDPDGFLSFQQILQQSVLPIFTEHGWWGLALLVALFAIALVLKEMIIGIAKLLWKFISACWRWISSKIKKPKKKAPKHQPANSGANTISP